MKQLRHQLRVEYHQRNIDSPRDGNLFELEEMLGQCREIDLVVFVLTVFVEFDNVSVLVKCVGISSTNGYLKQWENGTLVINYAGPTDKYSGSARSVGIGGYYRGYGNANNRRYFGDIYFDTTAARIILGNTSTLSTSTIREVQIATAWSANSITFNVNLGKFTTGQIAYLFVVDPTGASSATGFPVTIN